MKGEVNFVKLARQQALNKNYVSAFNMYVNAVEKQPVLKNEIKNEFRSVFLKMNEEIAVYRRKADIFSSFEKIMKIYPDNVDLLNDIGIYLFRYGYVTEALCNFEKVLSIDSNHIRAWKNLNNAKRCLFPRNIFRSLNDKMCNDAYRAAIKSCIDPGTNTVIDIDAGTGLLTLYANEFKPLSGTACKSSNPMVDLTECVIRENNALEVVIANQPSTILKEADIYGSRSVLITDMIDAGLFGNYILQSLCHAWENFLHKECKIIPGKAEFFVAGINCVDINNKYKLCQHTKNILNVPQLNVHTIYFKETYYSEDVHLYENVKYICEPYSLFNIDFNSRDEVFEMLNRQRPYNAVLSPTVDDEMNMVVGWFNLHLTDDIILTSDPRSKNRTKSWQQAVFFDIAPRKVRRNESFSIPFVPYGGRLTALPEPGKAITRVSQETVIFLNDTEYVDMIRKSVGIVCLHLGQTMNIEEADIVDLSPFPLFGVLMMKRGANSLTCKLKSREDKAFLNSVLEKNGIPACKVTILFSNYCTLEVFKNKMFHVIFTGIIDCAGEMNVRQRSILQHLQKWHLSSNGICLPASVTIMGQLVYSKDLEISNRVVDDNVDYRLAKHANRYQVSQLSYINITQLNFEPLSQAFEISSCEDIVSNLVRVPILKDGEFNAILCWYKVQLIDGWNVTYTNRTNSFISSTAYMTNPVSKVFKDDKVNVLLCVEPHGTFKLALDIAP